MPAIIGLDLGSGNFRAIEISGKEKKYHISSFAVSNTISFSEEASYIQNLKDLIKEHKMTAKDVYLSLPERTVFSTILKIPSMSEKEIKGYLEYESERIFPRPLAEISYSFEVLGNDAVENNKLEVLVIATPNNIVEKYMKIAKGAGFSVKGIEPETFSITRALNRYVKPSSSSGIMIANIGLMGTDLVILREGFIRFSKAYPIGGDTFTKALQESLGLALDQAEEYKKTYGLEVNVMEGKIFNVLKPFVDSIVNEINRAKNFYVARNQGIYIGKVVFTGGSALMPGLLYYMASTLDFEVELANPFAGIEFGTSITEDAKNSVINRGPMFTVSTGLALKEFID
jgi:type IV pilus assembly protein PilM